MVTWLVILRKLWPFALAACLLAWVAVVTMQRDNARADALAARNALSATEANVRAATAQAHAADIENVRRVETAQVAITEKTVDQYETRLASLRADYADRVRRATEAASRGGAGANLPGVPEAAGRADESAGNPQLSLRERLVASETAEQLVALQAWVTAQVGVN